MLTNYKYIEEAPWKNTESQEMEEEDTEIDGEPSNLLLETDR